MRNEKSAGYYLKRKKKENEKNVQTQTEHY